MPRKKKIIVAPAEPQKQCMKSKRLGVPHLALIALALVALAGVSAASFAQVAGANVQSGCGGVVSCAQSFVKGVWATIIRVPPQKSTANAWERITSPSADAEYGNTHPFILQPKEGDFVGIGTDNPRAKLQINGGSSDDFMTGTTPGIYIDELEKQITNGGALSFTYTPRIILSGDQTSESAPISPYIDFSNQAGAQYTARIQNKGADLALDSKSGNVLLQSVSGGNVGIGTTNPSVGLMVTRGVATELTKGKSFVQIGNDVKTDDINLALDHRSIQVRKKTDSGVVASDLLLNPLGGNVGIGGTDPKTKLDIAGTARLTLWADPASGAGLELGYNGQEGVVQGYSRDGGGSVRDILLNPTGGNVRIGGGLRPFTTNGSISQDLRNREGITISRAANTDYNLAVGKEETFGNVGISNIEPKYKLDVAHGDINVAYFGSNLTNADKKQKLALANDRIGLDVAEIYQTDEDVEVGDVLVAGTKDRTLQKSSKQYEPDIIGIVSGAPALLFEGSELKLGSNPNRFTKGTKPPVALAGRVPVKVSLENGPVHVGDYLTSSSKPGVAMRATDPGMALGVALEDYGGGGDGKALVFINIGEKNIAKRLIELEKELKALKKKK